MGPSPLIAFRAISVAITSAIWWVILYIAGWLFAGAGKVDHVSPLAMANITALSYLFIPYFATESTLVSMIGALMKKRIIMPDNAEDPKARPSNPWLLATINAVAFGIIPAVIGYMLSKNAAPDTISPSTYGVRFAWGGIPVVAIVTWFVSGRPFLKQARVPVANRAYQGGVEKYLWTRYILPHGIANFIINGALAYALAPMATEAGAAIVVPNEVVIGDGVIALMILTGLISAGAKGMARTETEWGVATYDFRADLHMPAAFLPCVFSGIGVCIVLGLSFWIFDVNGLGVTTWAVLRGIAFGVYCGWVAKRCAQASINETFHPEIIVHTRPPKQPAIATVAIPNAQPARAVEPV